VTLRAEAAFTRAYVALSSRRRLACAAALLAAPLLRAGAQTPVPAALPVDVTRATLPNGLQVVVLRDRLAPGGRHVLNYLAGSDDEPITGLAHAQEHMMFRGSATVDASQFSKAIAVTGAPSMPTRRTRSRNTSLRCRRRISPSR